MMIVILIYRVYVSFRIYTWNHFENDNDDDDDENDTNKNYNKSSLTHD